ncbi:hypothetical protein D9613_000078 [Agrocybe pediades]|uniref:Uncharacterized protein n=1 Tax=Agrocybe pediades TaxID=84607 RepID=A0A8H4R0P5_9AGAR|nr:hypothetical protein D9613_000078 [Agrocybe pediades]
MDHGTYDQHDEINLIRLVRRLEKSVARSDDWKPSVTLPAEEIWLKAQKTRQKVKFARRLLKNVEVNDFEPSASRIKHLNDFKIKLDRVDTFIKDIEMSSKPESHIPEPILPTLPVPRPPLTPSVSSNANLPPPTQPELSNPDLLSPPEASEKPQSSSPSVSTKGLTIVPPDPDELSPSLITTALPSLLPSHPPETAVASAFSRNFGPIPTNRKAGASTTLAHGSTVLHEELSSQLELMAQQLKRNAIHFSSSLEKDKSVVEDAQGKLEGNYDVMQKERVRLRDRSSASRSNTCLVIGVVALVLLLFMLMVSVIRFS